MGTTWNVSSHYQREEGKMFVSPEQCPMTKLNLNRACNPYIVTKLNFDLLSSFGFPKCHPYLLQIHIVHPDEIIFWRSFSLSIYTI